jgi:hypothetical protein
MMTGGSMTAMTIDFEALPPVDLLMPGTWLLWEPPERRAGGRPRATLSGDKREVKKPMVVIDIIYIDTYIYSLYAADSSLSRFIT